MLCTAPVSRSCARLVSRSGAAHIHATHSRHPSCIISHLSAYTTMPSKFKRNTNNDLTPSGKTCDRSLSSAWCQKMAF